jgi:predicted nucleic acid-binding protein
VANDRVVTLVDSNVLLDVLGPMDAEWRDWSEAMLLQAADAGMLAINPIIYAEVSVRYSTIEALDDALPGALYRREPLPWAASFLAGKCFMRYRERGGTRTSPLPDLLIGAHAAVRGHRVLTRDPRRYRAYFPRLEVIAPG